MHAHVADAPNDDTGGSRQGGLERLKHVRGIPVVLTCSEQFHLVGVGVCDDADDALGMAAVRALQRATVDVEQMHGVGADSEDVIRGCSEHGGD